VTQTDLKPGDRFELTQLGAERCSKFEGRTGTVLGSARNCNGVRVLLDGTKGARSLHRTYIKQIANNDLNGPSSDLNLKMYGGLPPKS